MSICHINVLNFYCLQCNITVGQKIIKSTKIIGTKIGQVPREVEISVACNVLEKERAQVGGCHYGHAVNSQSTMGSDSEYLYYAEEWSKKIRTVKLADVDD